MLLVVGPVGLGQLWLCHYVIQDSRLSGKILLAQKMFPSGLHSMLALIVRRGCLWDLSAATHLALQQLFCSCLQIVQLEEY